jgi:hypothetical protein
MGPILDMVAVSRDVWCVSCEELNDVKDHFYYAILPRLQSLAALPPRLLHHGAIKLAVVLMQSTSSRMIFHRPFASFPTAKKKEGIEKHI